MKMMKITRYYKSNKARWTQRMIDIFLLILLVILAGGVMYIGVN